MPASKSLIESTATKYQVKIEWLDHNNYGRNGGSSCHNIITLKPSDKDWIYEISFWHELGHIILSRLMGARTHYMSKLSCEGSAWELGLNEAAKHERIWSYGSEQMKWARQQLATYVNGEYDDIKEFYRQH